MGIQVKRLTKQWLEANGYKRVAPGCRVRLCSGDATCMVAGFDETSGLTDIRCAWPYLLICDEHLVALHTEIGQCIKVLEKKGEKGE